MGETVAPPAQAPAPPAAAEPANSAAPETPALAPASTPAAPPPAPDAPEQPPAPADAAAPAPAPAAPSWETLVEQADPADLRRNRRLMGIAGEMANRLAETRAEQLLQDRLPRAVDEAFERRQAEADRRALLEAAREGNFYAVGQRYAEVAEREEVARQTAEARGTAEHDAYRTVQSAVDGWAQTLPPEVLAAAQQRYQQAPRGSGYSEQFVNWLQTFVPAYAEHLVQQRQAEWEAKQLPALRSRALAEVNGSAQVPQTGGGDGVPPGVRVVTDEEISRMSPQQWQAVWDTKAGTFKDGIVHRPTRSIDLRTPPVGPISTTST
jgi:hypothetical protein